MAGILERLRAAMNEARKSRNSARTLLFSTILADLKNSDIALGHEPSDPEAVEVLRRGVKRRTESVEQYGKGGRQDLADKEAAEIKMLEEFLPALADPEEIRAAVRAAIAAGSKDLGKVMGAMMPQFKGRADGKIINQIVREELASAS
ncbi:MAG TPA: GatB/YqeY domain-containing protein [Gemmatimonadales bacterium]|nr:GatB/YqeY domain-containing protein [Gemmatimonadales bacterium]